MSTFALVSGSPPPYLCLSFDHQKRKKMKYTLFVKETANKAGRFTYTVRDENDQVISERKSNRVYVACTIYGGSYFGRLDLIGKGSHYDGIMLAKGYMKDWNSRTRKSEWQPADMSKVADYAKKYVGVPELLERYITEIAYLETVTDAERAFTEARLRAI